jgi:hypothetical protein
MYSPHSLVVLGLTLAASASPAGGLNRRAVTGTNTNGSIFRFGSATDCRSIFRAYGACGISTYFNWVDGSIPLVAMPAEVFDMYGAAQHNTLCAKVITLTRNGVTQKAIVADRNLSVDHSIDMCLDTWQAFGGHDNDGSLIKGFSWSIDDGSSPAPTTTSRATSTPTTVPCSWEGHCAGKSDTQPLK